MTLPLLHFEIQNSIHSSDFVSRNAREWEELFGNKQVNFTDDFYQAANIIKGTTDHVVDEVVLSHDGQTLAVKGNDSLGNNLYAIYKPDNFRNIWKYDEAPMKPLSGQTIPGNNIALSANGAGIAVAGLSCNPTKPALEPQAGSICHEFGDRIVGDVSVNTFGTSVALNHDSTVLAVGSSQGKVYVYDATAAQIKGNLDDSSLIGNTINISGSDGQFFNIVKVAGNKMTPTVVVGGDINEIKVFRYEASTGWRVLGSGIESNRSNLSGGGLTELDGIHFDVSKDGDVIAVRVGASKSVVKVYEWKSGAWAQRGQNLRADGDDDYASISLSGDGNIIAVGSYNKGTQSGNSRPGVVRLYEYVNNSWRSYSFPVGGIPGLDDEVNFGRSVSLSGDGKVLAVAAPAYSNIVDKQKGYVSVFSVGDAFPSESPSDAPSEKPSTPTSNAPSSTSMPSSNPATPPSDNPTETPSHSPTISFRPTPSPTISFRPTPSPTPAPTPSTCKQNCHCKEGSECDLSECRYDCNCEGGFCNMQKCEYDCRCKGGNCNMNRCGSNCQCEMRGCQMDNCIYNTRCVARTTTTSGSVRRSGTLVIATVSLLSTVLAMV